MTIEDEASGSTSLTSNGRATRRGLGLLSIRERVTGLRGTVSIESAVRNGSRIEVELPAVAPRRVDDLDPVLVASLIDSEVNGG